ncbi:deoxynucleoside triphosphate triphosphohydrolase SAMHD1-like [Pseudorasbora parva]|uniref:deoxynucleoside triphosphate triphosphohydrolase SAMHD1-like n=1 Tax=Pseudorasbora parva TaxID=51549 RepID=UPI00351E00D6
MNPGGGTLNCSPYPLPTTASFWILLDIIKSRGITELDEEDLRSIQKLINGDYSKSPKKIFLFEILANKFNGIDVRRWDYFARDCHHLGIPNSFDHQRLLKSARVCEVEGENHICFRDKVADNVYDMFHTRYSLYLQAYKHKIVNIIADKIKKALLKAKDKFEIKPILVSQDDIENKIKSNSTAEDEKTAKFIKLTDHIFERILYYNKDGLKGAQKEIEDVVRRRLPKCVGETRLSKPEEKEDISQMREAFKASWNTAVKEWNKLHPTVFLDMKDFNTDVIQLDYNKNNENPLNHVYFYRKKKQTKGYKIKKYERSSLLPEEFTEYVGRVYYTKNSDEEEKDAKECFKWWRLGMIQLFEQEDFQGSMHETTVGCRSVEDRFGIRAVHSCKVFSGVWKLYEGRDFSQTCHQLEEGVYPKPAMWGSQSNAPALSLKPK